METYLVTVATLDGGYEDWNYFLFERNEDENDEAFKLRALLYNSFDYDEDDEDEVVNERVYENGWLLDRNGDLRIKISEIQLIDSKDVPILKKYILH
jgi:hypothetical protein